MTPEQELHLATIKRVFGDCVDAKYRRGQAEHGGNLWDNSPLVLLDFAIDEAIDQVTYLLTLREKVAEQQREALVERSEHA